MVVQIRQQDSDEGEDSIVTCSLSMLLDSARGFQLAPSQESPQYFQRLSDKLQQKLRPGPAR